MDYEGSLERLADVNGDGPMDMVMRLGTSLTVRLGRADGTFGDAIPSALPANVTPGSGDVATADFDGDGRPDLVVRSNSNFISNRGQAWQRLTVFLGRGKGRFDAGTTIRGGGFLGPITIAHLNGDQLPDLLVGNSIDFWVTVLLNEGPIAGNANRLDLALPAAAAGYEIQSSTNPGGPWTAMTEGSSRSIHGPARALQLEMSGTHRFFRLRKP